MIGEVEGTRMAAAWFFMEMIALSFLKRLLAVESLTFFCENDSAQSLGNPAGKDFCV